MCRIAEPETNLCGTDANGFEYYCNNVYSTLICGIEGYWQIEASPDIVPEVVCQAFPCPEILPGEINAVEVACHFDGEISESIEGSKVLLLCLITNSFDITKGYLKENTVCELITCESTHSVPEISTTTCRQGVWTNELMCQPVACPNELTSVENGEVSCPAESQDLLTGLFSLGAVCQLTCEAGYEAVGSIECLQDNSWSEAFCGKKKLCINFAH